MNKRLAAVLGFALSASCGKSTPTSTPQRDASAAPAPRAGAADTASPVVAVVEGQSILLTELDAHAKAELSRAEAEHAERVHSIRTTALDALVEKRLIEKAAQAQGLTSEQLMEREVAAKAPKPSEQEIKELWERTKTTGRPLPPFELVREDIEKFLTQRKGQGVREEFLTALKSGAQVQIKLPPLLLPRVKVEPKGPARGDPAAPVTVIEFSDFECPFCGRAEAVVAQVMQKYDGKVRLIFRDFPLPFHAKAQKAAEAALCAGEQDKYWPMHETLFANQQALGLADLKGHAKRIGLEGKKFADCLDSSRMAPVVEASKQAGEAAGVTGTPAFFINGRPLSGAQPFEKFQEIIDAELVPSKP